MTESMSDLEAFLHKTYGINIIARRKLIAAYKSDDAKTLMKEILADPVNFILPEVKEQLVVLVEGQDEDATLAEALAVGEASGEATAFYFDDFIADKRL